MSSGTDPLARAVLAALNASTALQTAVGRADQVAVAWGGLDLDQDPLPIVCLEDLGTGGSFLETSDRVAFLVAAFAAGPDADEKTDALLDIVEQIITTQMLQSSGLDAGLDPTTLPFPRDRVPVEDDGLPELVQRTMALAILYTPAAEVS